MLNLNFKDILFLDIETVPEKEHFTDLSENLQRDFEKKTASKTTYRSLSGGILYRKSRHLGGIREDYLYIRRFFCRRGFYIRV
jgi:predicted transcriptional regulator